MDELSCFSVDGRAMDEDRCTSVQLDRPPKETQESLGRCGPDR